jgi:hypothetical protein
VPWSRKTRKANDSRVGSTRRSIVTGEITASMCDSPVINSTGSLDQYELPHLGAVEVHTDKGGERTFDRMLADISRSTAALPFAAGTGGAIPYDRSIGLDERVLYHAFVYLRHILSDTAPRDQLLPSLRVILADPHRVLERVSRDVPLTGRCWLAGGARVGANAAASCAERRRDAARPVAARASARAGAGEHGAQHDGRAGESLREGVSRAGGRHRRADPRRGRVTRDGITLLPPRVIRRA